MILVGISGAIDHGKTSFAEFLTAASPTASHFESSDIIMEVANALRSSGPAPASSDFTAIVEWLRSLPPILSDVAHASVRFSDLAIDAACLQTASDEFATLISYLRLMELQPELASKPINTANKDDYRVLLQWIGGYVAKHVSGQLWYQEIIRRGQASGCELVVAGGVRFPDDAACLRAAGGVIIMIDRPSMVAQQSDDVTERERALIVPDATVVNDGSLEALRLTAIQVYEDLAKGSLAPMYAASNIEPPARTGLSLSV